MFDVRRRPAWGTSLLPLLAWALLLVCDARAELPAARLTSALPAGAQPGVAIEVTLTGQDLDDLKSLHFSDPRITAKPGSAAGKFMVTAAADVAPGIYDVRAVGRFGVSNPRAFVISSLPVSLAKPGNNTPATTAPIAVGQSVFAVAEANIIQYFKLPLKKGQRIFVQVDSKSIDSRMEPSVTLAGPAGEDLQGSQRGELLDFTPKADGDYMLKVSDSTYRGGPEFFYRLTVHTGPQIDFVEPPMGLPGKGKYTLIGRNLPGGTPAQGVTSSAKALEKLSVEIELPADPEKQANQFSFIPSFGALLDGIDYRLTTPAGTSNAARIGFATAPVVLKDASSKAAPEGAGQKITVPAEVAGRFLPRGERDCYSFDAPAKSVFWVEVFSHRLGYPTAPFILIQKLVKDEKAGNKWTDVQEVYEAPADATAPLEFKTASRDPSFRLAVTDAATYRVVVRNLFTPVGDDGSFVYRLAVRKEAPDFRLLAFPGSPVGEKDSKDAPVTAPLLRRGGFAPLKVSVIRQDQFDGEVQVKVEGLPEGVTCAPVTIPATAKSAVLLLAASDNAKAGLAPLKITGTATINGAPVTHAARPGTIATSLYDTQTKTADVASRRARDLFIAVVEETSPLTITTGKDSKFETCVQNKLSIPVKVTRRGEFAGPMLLKLAGHPLLLPVKELTLDPKADSGTIELDLATVKLPAGTYFFNVETLAKLKYLPPSEVKEPKDPKDAKAPKPPAPKDFSASFYSAPIQVTITAAPITIPAPAAASIEAGGKAEAPIAITRLYGYADPVDLAIVAPNVKGLSGKVTLAKDQKEGKLALVADATTPPGEHIVKVSATMKLNNQNITIDQPITIKVAPAAAKPKAK